MGTHAAASRCAFSFGITGSVLKLTAVAIQAAALAGTVTSSLMDPSTVEGLGIAALAITAASGVSTAVSGLLYAHKYGVN